MFKRLARADFEDCFDEDGYCLDRGCEHPREAHNLLVGFCFRCELYCDDSPARPRPYLYERYRREFLE